MGQVLNRANAGFQIGPENTVLSATVSPPSLCPVRGRIAA